MKAFLFAISTSLLLGLTSYRADASSFVFQFTGHVTFIGFAQGMTNSLGFSIGNPVSSSFTLNLTSPEPGPNSNIASYPNSISSWTFSGISSSTSELLYSSFDADNQSPSQTTLKAYLNSTRPNESDVYALQLSVMPGVGVFSSGQIAESQLNAVTDSAAWTSYLVQFQRAVWTEASPNPQVVQIRASLETLTVTEVPEPSLIALLVPGLFLCRCHRKSRT